jgi:hypothetical protein
MDIRGNFDGSRDPSADVRGSIDSFTPSGGGGPGPRGLAAFGLLVSIGCVAVGLLWDSWYPTPDGEQSGTATMFLVGGVVALFLSILAGKVQRRGSRGRRWRLPRPAWPRRVRARLKAAIQPKPHNPCKDTWRVLQRKAQAAGFTVTGRNEKKGHNVGSPHYRGKAIDIRTRDHSPEAIERFMQQMRGEGYVVRDERIQPPGQEVWSGPHVHIEIPKCK